MKKQLSILAIIAASILGFSGAIQAQETADTPAQDAPAQPKEAQVVEKSLADMWKAGGVTMYPLGLFAIFGTTLIIYNFIAIRKKKF